jgi:glycosyltransferase involved in cell wall biosynthesis
MCMIDARKQNFDIIYMLGYTSSSIWQRILVNKAVVVTNMDGLEWKRSKYSPKVQRFLKYAEKLAVKHSDYLIADSIGIQSYLKDKYNIESKYLPYGSYLFENSSSDCLSAYSLTANEYDLLIARFEPENNIELILEGFQASDVKRKFALIGNYSHTDFGRRMYAKYSSDKRICFLGAIYNQEELNNIRYYSNLYFHGHSVGGTNPSLLEAMGSMALIASHENVFNQTILEQDAFYFNSKEQVKALVQSIAKTGHSEKISGNANKIRNIYFWPLIVDQYLNYFEEILLKKN